ncbi:MAG TPA: DNA repair exonuclease [Thermoanaerobaculia bacterium]|jgi:DNA repair exonuclease SbcCD nuclease subunit|nr:DNA repair exonuclease [Thermoanaerobaculia bacterium]
MFRFLHAADVHLDSPLRGLERYEGAPVEEIRGATRKAFVNLVDLAIREEVAFLLLAGDLYDGDWKDYNTGLFFIAQMRRLEVAGIPVFVVAGNHDAASQITKVLRPPANVRMLGTKKPETVRLEEIGAAIHGQGFAAASVKEDLSAGYPAADPFLFNVGLLHTSLDGRPGYANYAPCTVDGLRARGYQYWALGHVHEREEVSRDPWIVFPGVLQGRHVRETGAKGATLVTVEDREVLSAEARELDVMRWAVCAVDLTGVATTDQALEILESALEREVARANGRPLAVRVELGGACAVHEELRRDTERWTHEVRAVATRFGGDGVWIERVVLRTRRPAAGETGLDREVRDDALGGLAGSIRELEGDDARLTALAEELADLRRKLPAELFAAGDVPDFTAPASLREILPEVEDLLVARLLAVRSHEP